MRVAVFSTKPYDEEFLDRANLDRHRLVFLEPRLNVGTAPLADGSEAVCAFVNDDLGAARAARAWPPAVSAPVALRSAGYNHVDLGRQPSSGSSSPGCRPTRRTPSPSTRSV